MFVLQFDAEHRAGKHGRDATFNFNVVATICGKMRKRWVRLTVGDRVKMEMSPYDLDKARITWRLK